MAGFSARKLPERTHGTTPNAKWRKPRACARLNHLKSTVDVGVD